MSEEWLPKSEQNRPKLAKLIRDRRDSCTSAKHVTTSEPLCFSCTRRIALDYNEGPTNRVARLTQRLKEKDAAIQAALDGGPTLSPFVQAQLRAAVGPASAVSEIKDAITAHAERHKTPCTCAGCRCPELLTMPSEWVSNICVFCRTGHHPGPAANT